MKPTTILKRFNKLSDRMQIVANNYFFARCTLREKVELSDENFALMIAYVRCVNACFDKLQENEKIFLNKEFFFQAYPGWWKKEYSMEAYIRLKVSSIQHFMEEFYAAL